MRSSARHFERRNARGADGTRLAYYVGGRPSPAPVLVLSAGPLASGRMWTPQLAYLGDRVRMLSWDSRGLFGSARPERARGAYSITQQVGDLHAVLAAEGIERFAMIGWSFGVQLALEAYRELRDRVAALVLMSGGAGRPLETLGTPARVLVRGVLEGAQRESARFARPVPRKIARGIYRRLVSAAAPPDQVDELVDCLAAADASAFVQSLHAFAHHDAWSSLGAVASPSLVVMGARDPLTPPELGQQLARHLPNSDVVVVPGARHLVFVEYPDLVNLRLERFLHDAHLC